MKEEEEASKALGTDSAGDEERHRRREGWEEPQQGHRQQHEGSQECSRESGRDNIILINICAKPLTLVKSMPMPSSSTTNVHVHFTSSPNLRQYTSV